MKQISFYWTFAIWYCYLLINVTTDYWPGAEDTVLLTPEIAQQHFWLLVTVNGLVNWSHFLKYWTLIGYCHSHVSRWICSNCIAAVVSLRNHFCSTSFHQIWCQQLTRAKIVFEAWFNFLLIKLRMILLNWLASAEIVFIYRLYQYYWSIDSFTYTESQ